MSNISLPTEVTFTRHAWWWRTLYAVSSWYSDKGAETVHLSPKDADTEWRRLKGKGFTEVPTLTLETRWLVNPSVYPS